MEGFPSSKQVKRVSMWLIHKENEKSWMSLRSCGVENWEKLEEMDFKKWKGNRICDLWATPGGCTSRQAIPSIFYEILWDSINESLRSTFTARNGPKKTFPPFLAWQEQRQHKTWFSTSFPCFPAVNILTRCFRDVFHSHKSFSWTFSSHTPRTSQLKAEKCEGLIFAPRTPVHTPRPPQLLSSSIRCVNMCGKST